MFPSAKFVRHLYVWHKWTGILGGAFVLFLLLSGTIAVFREEIDWLVTPALRVEPRGAKRPLEEMLGAAARAFPAAEVNSIQVAADATTAHVFSLTEKGGTARTVFVNPYTAEVTGTRRGETLANVSAFTTSAPTGASSSACSVCCYSFRA